MFLCVCPKYWLKIQNITSKKIVSDLYLILFGGEPLYLHQNLFWILKRVQPRNTSDRKENPILTDGGEKKSTRATRAIHSPLGEQKKQTASKSELNAADFCLKSLPEFSSVLIVARHLDGVCGRNLLHLHSMSSFMDLHIRQLGLHTRG